MPDQWSRHLFLALCWRYGLSPYANGVAQTRATFKLCSSRPGQHRAWATLHGLAKRHDISRNLIRVWVERYQAGAFDEDAAAADLVQQYEARIAALERLVGKQALELEFLKGALRDAPRRRAATRQYRAWSSRPLRPAVA